MEQIIIKQFDEAEFDDYIESVKSMWNIDTINIPTIKQNLQNIINNNDYQIFVAKNDGTIIGTITCLVEQKIIHNCGKAGHIADLTVNKLFLGQGVKEKLVKRALEFFIENNCYKTILNCSKEEIPIHEKNNLKEYANVIANEHIQ